jgi:uncharacterized protein (TIGR02453 family)
MAKQHFTPAFFEFLDALARNNDRDWFKAHQANYEEHVREPALEFINDFAAPLGEMAPEFVADSRTVGGSLFRIQRDTRFAKDKTPYKENTGVQFRHRMAKDVHAPGFYLNLQPGTCYMGVGIWRPETKVAYRIRDAIVDRPEAWVEATTSRPFAAVLQLEGDSLSRPPQGYPPDHPLIEDLKRKDFIASARLGDRDVTAGGFIDAFAAMCRLAEPFMRFLCGAVGVPY